MGGLWAGAVRKGRWPAVIGLTGRGVKFGGLQTRLLVDFNCGLKLRAVGPIGEDIFDLLIAKEVCCSAYKQHSGHAGDQRELGTCSRKLSRMIDSVAMKAPVSAKDRRQCVEGHRHLKHLSDPKARTNFGAQQDECRHGKRSCGHSSTHRRRWRV